MKTVFALVSLISLVQAVPFRRGVNGFNLGGAVKSIVYLPEFGCTGSIISSNVVLTAAHCVPATLKNETINVALPTSYKEVFPQFKDNALYDNIVSVVGNDYEIVKMWKHPLYNDSANGETPHDIALLQLNTSVLNGKTGLTYQDLMVLDNPTLYDSELVLADAQGVLMSCGYGKTWNSSIEPLRNDSQQPFQCVVGLTSSDGKTCTKARADAYHAQGVYDFDGNNTFVYPKDAMCGIFVNTTNCHGDSGGPAMTLYNKKTGQVYTPLQVKNGDLDNVPDEDLESVQTGIVSWGAEKDKVCFKGFTAYCMVSTYYAQIKDAICSSVIDSESGKVCKEFTDNLAKFSGASRLDTLALKEWRAYGPNGIVLNNGTGYIVPQESSTTLPKSGGGKIALNVLIVFFMLMI